MFAGKSWCQYFCPMGVVQIFYSEPRSLLGSKAHQGAKKTVTQSMCRSCAKQWQGKKCLCWMSISLYGYRCGKTLLEKLKPPRT